MKKIIIISIALLFMIIPVKVNANNGYKDLYEAYKINPNDENAESILSEMMMENPPKSISLKVIKFQFDHKTGVPLEGTINVDLGKSATYKTNFKFEFDKHQFDYGVTLILNYEKEGSARFTWDISVNYYGPHYIYDAGAASYRVEYKSTVYKSTYNSGLVTHKNYAINMRTEEHKALGTINFEIVGVSFNGTANITNIIDTIASGDIGETVTSIIAVIVIGAMGFVAASAGVSAATGEKTQNEEEKEKFKMVVYKNFGDKIKMGEKPGTVEARMVEITSSGKEIERLDLTSQIEIFSPDNVINVSNPSLKGDAMTSLVDVPNRPSNSRARINNRPSKNEGIISFRFKGEGGEFQNNVKFKIIGESSIDLENKEFPILGTSSDEFELLYELVDFATEPKVELIYKSNLFDLKLGKNKQGKNVIIAKTTEEANKKKFEKFIHSYPCEIIAKNEEETVKEKFELHLCYEGIGTSYKDCNNIETNEEIKIYCFSDAESAKREEKAARIPLCVMRWDDTSKKLILDQKAVDKLTFDFSLKDNKNKKAKELTKAIEEAKIVAKIDTSKNAIKIDNKYLPTIFMIYPEKNTIASDPEINVTIKISSPNSNLDDLILESKLIPQADYKAMITWFIEYPRGTYVDKFIKIGNVDTYHGALDFIENRVYCESNIPYTPKKIDGKLDNHYEDGKYDVSRPTYVFLLDRSMPHQIGDFEQIQSLHHELCHAIEHQHGDTGNKKNNERHSYFIQYLSDVAHTLADIERGKLDPILGGTAIQAFHRVLYNDTNASPQTFSWFGVEYVPPSMLFGRYAEFETYGPSNVPDDRKRIMAKYFREHYYPADFKKKKEEGLFVAKFKEKTGPFKNAVWSIIVTENFKGMFSGVSLKHPDYEFETVKPAEWIPGTLSIKTTFRIKSKKTKVTELVEVELNGGDFNPMAERYPVIDKFTVSWKSLEKVSDTILGNPNIKTEAIAVKE